MKATLKVVGYWGNETRVYGYASCYIDAQELQRKARMSTLDNHIWDVRIEKTDDDVKVYAPIQL